jgi:hypothetical protein
MRSPLGIKEMACSSDIIRMNERQTTPARASANGTDAVATGVSRRRRFRLLLRSSPPVRRSGDSDRSLEAAYRAALFHP